ncbi:hypothetical protein [Microvirga zambiensis]|uniref:hypothetical protein n=1 Tax=Microvirga zambiensis TaxID=1402137 RepID=UPI00191D22D1|nr:hypothetical protein [Microvirga zambiensis]
MTQHSDRVSPGTNFPEEASQEVEGGHKIHPPIKSSEGEREAVQSALSHWRCAASVVSQYGECTPVDLTRWTPVEMSQAIHRIGERLQSSEAKAARLEAERDEARARKTEEVLLREKWVHFGNDMEARLNAAEAEIDALKRSHDIEKANNRRLAREVVEYAEWAEKSEARLSTLTKALEPFAKAAELLPADGRLDKEMIWAPAQGRIIYGKHFRAAQAAHQHSGVPVTENTTFPRTNDSEDGGHIIPLFTSEESGR